MLSDLQGQQLGLLVVDKDKNGDNPSALLSDQIRAGISTPMTHTERQEFHRRSHLGKVLGITEYETNAED